MSLTFSCGKKTVIPTPGTFIKPFRAALPVSPLVAVTIITRLPLPASAADINCGSMQRATSLKADVGP